MFIVADLVSLIDHHFCLKQLLKFGFQMATVLSGSKQQPTLVGELFEKLILVI